MKKLLILSIFFSTKILSIINTQMIQKSDATYFLFDPENEKTSQKVFSPLMAYELEDRFNLNDALAFGLLPIRFATENPTSTLQKYIYRYINQEVFSKGLIKNRKQFIQFLQILPLYHGTQLNVAKIARECCAKRTTVNDWLKVLEKLFLCFKLDAFALKAKQSVSLHPKIFFFDTGVFRILDGFSADPIKSNNAALKGLVAQHLIAWRDYTSEKHELNFWRTRTNKEVDFILYGPLGFWAFEVKNSDTIRSNDLSALESFGEDYPEATLILLYRGKDKLRKNNVLCLPCEDFLKKLCPNKPLEIVF